MHTRVKLQFIDSLSSLESHFSPSIGMPGCWLFISVAVIHYARPNGTSVSKYITLSSHLGALPLLCAEKQRAATATAAPLFFVRAAHDFLLTIIGEAVGDYV